MIKYDQNQYVEIFYKLPLEIKDVVAATSTTEHLWKIGQKHNLHIDKIGVMTDLAFDVMMGIVASRNFVAELQKELGIDALDAANLARDIDENVFHPIKESMVKLYGDKAPNKPSSTLVTLTEDDEEHIDLDKDLLLREIESPIIAKTRVDITSSATRVAPPSKEESEPMKMAETREVEEYHTELEQKGGREEVKKVEEKVPEIKPIPSTLDRLADMKLSQTFVMPRKEGWGRAEEGKRGSIENKMEELEKKEPMLVAPIKMTTPLGEKPKVDHAVIKAAPEAPKSYAADPYREAIN